MVSYYKFIEAIWFLCFILLVLNLPLFYMFSDYNIYTDKPIAAMSLGNFGGASTICEQIPHHMSSKSLRLQCPSGHLDPFARSHDGELIFQVGLMDANQKNVAACRQEAFHDEYNCT